MRSRLPRRARAIVLVLVGLFAPASVGAEPVVDLSWHACSPIVAQATAESGPVLRAMVSVLGQSAGLQGYEARIFLQAQPRPASLPDAWRFDAEGCQTSSLIQLRHQPFASVAKACPSFTRTPLVVIADYRHEATSNYAWAVIATSFPPGVPAPDPGTRYFLMGVEFDHTFSVIGLGTPGLTCGGYETDLTLSMTILGCLNCGTGTMRWLDLAGVEHLYTKGSAILTFCGSCSPTPAHATTWGAIKGAYRR